MPWKDIELEQIYGDTFVLGKLSATGLDLNEMKATGYFIDSKPFS